MRSADSPAYIKKLKSKDINIIYEQFEMFVQMISQMFENKEFCRKMRLF